MNKASHLLLAGLAVLALCGVGRAQDRLPEALPAAAAGGGDGPAMLRSLPHLPDLPSSLFAPPPPPTFGAMPIDAPYFTADPLLDSPQLGVPGWFGGAELQVLKPHVIQGLSDVVQNRAQKAAGTSTTVSLPGAPLGWTVSPRFFVGYRLPSGFGELMASYRYLGTTGREDTAGRDGPATVKSRLAFNMIDLDYNSRELSLWPNWDMRWTLGARILTLFFDSRLSQSVAQAAAGSGIVDARQDNNLAGGGPHAALELARRLGNSGWALTCRADFASVFEGSHLGFFTQSTNLGPNGRPLFGATHHFGTQDTPILNVRGGLSWRPSLFTGCRVFLGYQYERFWALDRLPPAGPNPPSLGQVWDQGIVLQATIRY
jgi:hypothetical protein